MRSNSMCYDWNMKYWNETAGELSECGATLLLSHVRDTRKGGSPWKPGPPAGGMPAGGIPAGGMPAGGNPAGGG